MSTKDKDTLLRELDREIERGKGLMEGGIRGTLSKKGEKTEETSKKM